MVATRDPTYKALAQRIQTMYFLGTPHRGADAAQLARIARFSAGHGTKAFLDDLVPGSAALNVCSNILYRTSF